MELTKLTVPFKGKRNYIQGPDLYNFIFQGLKADSVRELRFAVHSFIETSHLVRYSTEDYKMTPTYSSAPVKSTFFRNGKMVYRYIVPDETQPVRTDRIEYNEALILENCRFAENAIISCGESPYTFMETVVSMNKILLGKQYPDLTGKWIFNKAEMAYLCNEVRDLKVKLFQNVGFRLFKSKVFRGSEFLGHLYFSMENK